MVDCSRHKVYASLRRRAISISMCFRIHTQHFIDQRTIRIINRLEPLPPVKPPRLLNDTNGCIRAMRLFPTAVESPHTGFVTQRSHINGVKYLTRLIYRPLARACSQHLARSVLRILFICASSSSAIFPARDFFAAGEQRQLIRRRFSSNAHLFQHMPVLIE